jgi:hypothetical protein
MPRRSSLRSAGSSRFERPKSTNRSRGWSAQLRLVDDEQVARMRIGVEEPFVDTCAQ